jgi:hypothetical protein
MSAIIRPIRTEIAGVKGVGKNMFDKSKAILRPTGYVDASGDIVPSALYYNLFVKIQPNTQYKLSNHLNSNTFWYTSNMHHIV